MWVAWNNYWNWLTRQNLGPLILLISEVHLKPKLNLQGLGVSRTTTDLLWGILVPGFMVWNFMKPLNKHRKSDPDLTTLPETNSLPLKNDVSVLGRLPLFFLQQKTMLCQEAQRFSFCSPFSPAWNIVNPKKNSYIYTKNNVPPLSHLSKPPRNKKLNFFDKTI